MGKSTRTTRAHFVSCLEHAKLLGYSGLTVTLTDRNDVQISGYHPEVNEGKTLCQAQVVCGHTCRDLAVKQQMRCERWLGQEERIKRPPSLAARVVLKIDTGMATSTIMIPRYDRDGKNNADAFLREVLHFGIMRHGVNNMLERLQEMAADPKYAKYMDNGLRQ